MPSFADQLAHLRVAAATGNLPAHLGAWAVAQWLTEGEAQHALHRSCRYAGLPEFLWHRLRHSYATHAALLGVSPIRLQHWLGTPR